MLMGILILFDCEIQMTSYTVHKIFSHNSMQLLLVQGRTNDVPIELCVYNEHTGNTVMRLTSPTLESFERAIALIRDAEQV